MDHITTFFQAILAQDATVLHSFFQEDALVRWHCTNEQFTAEAYIRANCAYPGSWMGKIESVHQMNNGLTVMVTHVWPKDGATSHHCVSFIRWDGDRIAALDEYWADDSPPPRWRRELGLGEPIPAKD